MKIGIDRFLIILLHRYKVRGCTWSPFSARKIFSVKWRAMRRNSPRWTRCGGHSCPASPQSLESWWRPREKGYWTSCEVLLPFLKTSRRVFTTIWRKRDCSSQGVLWLCISLPITLLNGLFFDRRFYFLSNDELLEILSKTKEPERIQPHLRKCFDGISRLQFNSNQEIQAMVSNENEVVRFRENIVPAKSKVCLEAFYDVVNETNYAGRYFFLRGWWNCGCRRWMMP